MNYFLSIFKEPEGTKYNLRKGEHLATSLDLGEIAQRGGLEWLETENKELLSDPDNEEVKIYCFPVSSKRI